MKTTKIIAITLLLMSALFSNVNAQCIAFAGNDTTVCGYSVNLHGTWSHNLGAELSWTSTLPNVYFSNPTDENTTAMIPNYTTSSFQVTFIFTETIPPAICVSSDTVVVTFIHPPHAEAGPSQHVCGYTTALTADTLGAGIISGSWSCNIPGVTFTTTGGGIVPAAYSDVDASGASGQFVNSKLEAYCYWTAVSGTTGCTNTDSVLVTFYEIPVAYAGEDDSICGKTYQMQGIGSVMWSPSCSWTTIQKPYPTSSAVYTQPSPTAQMTVSDYGCYTFVWTEQTAGNVTCFDKDTVTICFQGIPQPDAGPDQSVCGKHVLLNATNAGQGYWHSVLNAWYDASVFPNDTVYCPSCSQNPSVYAYYSSENDTVTYYWTETNSCGSSTDSVNVYFGSIQPAINLVDPADSLACGNSTNVLSALMPAYGNGYWYDAQTPTQFFPNNFSNNPDSTVISSNSYGWHYFHWVTINGSCRDTSSAVPVKFVQKPNANAGSNYWPGLFGPNSYLKTDTACGLQYQLSAVPSIGQGLWFTLDPLNTWFSSVGTDWTGCANPSPMPNDTVNILLYTVYTYPYYRDFVWIENNDECIDRDTVRIYFAPMPTPDAGPDQSVCGKYAELCANTTPGTDGYWQSTIIAWIDPTNWPSDTVYCMPCSSDPCGIVHYASENDTVTFFWMETSAYGCFGYDSVNVYFGSIQQAMTLVDPADSVVCGNLFTGLNAQNPSYGFGYWYDNDTATTFYVGADPAVPDSVVIGTNSWGYHNFYWATSNGDCGDTSAAVTVLFNGLGGVYGTISGLGGNTDYTAGLFESGSPIIRASGTPDPSGNYFINANGGQYYLKVDNDNSSTNTGIATTYYGDTWKWSDAILLDVPACDTTTANITMYTFPLATGGVCRAYGTVMYDMGGPVENADVYLLYKPSNTPAILQKTNASGYYSLNNIPNGNYKIQVDIPGLPQVTTHHITVNPGDTAFPNVNFIVDTINISKDYGYGVYADSNFVYGMGEQLSDVRLLHVYPVPFSGELFIESFSDANMSIEWYSQKGEMISVSEMNYFKGTNSIVVPDDLSKGIYYLKITTGNTVYIKKLIKE